MPLVVGEILGSFFFPLGQTYPPVFQVLLENSLHVKAILAGKDAFKENSLRDCHLISLFSLLQ